LFEAPAGGLLGHSLIEHHVGGNTQSRGLHPRAGMGRSTCGRTMDRVEILRTAAAIAADQAGGDAGNDACGGRDAIRQFVLCHLRETGEVLFGSGLRPQHTPTSRRRRSIVSDRQPEVIRDDWTAFNRVVIEGRVTEIARDDPRYEELLAELSTKNRMAAVFTDRGALFMVVPRRLILMKGLEQPAISWSSSDRCGQQRRAAGKIAPWSTRGD